MTADSPVPDPFWGTVNGKPLKIRTMAATGPHGSGKSLLGNLIDPHRTLAIDIESSSTAFNLPFKTHLIAFNELMNNNIEPTPLNYFEWWMAAMEGIKPGEYTVVCVDPINEIGQGAYDYIVANHDKFGISASQVHSASGLVWGRVAQLIEQIVGKLSGKIETFYYVLHEGNVWRNGKPVEGQKKAKGGAVFRKIADVIFVLDRPVDKKTGVQVEAPNASIVPPIGKSRLVFLGDDQKPHPILPPYIKGLDADKVRAYIAKPPNYEKLKREEKVPVPEDLTDDEKLLIEKQISENRLEAEQLREAGRKETADAVARNAAARKKAAEERDSQAVLQEAAESPTEEAVPKVTKEDWPEILKDQWKRRGFGAPQMKACIKKHAGDAKLADCTEEQCQAMYQENLDALTAVAAGE